MLSRFARNLSIVLAGAGVALLIAFAIATLVDGLSRSILKNPVDAVRDLGGMIVAVSVASFVPLAFLERSNIEATFIDGVVSEGVARVLALFAAVVTLVFMILFAWQFLINAFNFQAAGEITPMLGYARAPFWFVIDGLLWCGAAVQAVVVLEIARDGIGARVSGPPEDGSTHPSI